MGKAGLIEMLFSFGVILALCAWEIYSLRRDKKKKTGDASDSAADKPSPRRD